MFQIGRLGYLANPHPITPVDSAWQDLQTRFCQSRRMQVGRITAEIRRFGAVATVIWTAPAVLSLSVFPVRLCDGQFD